MSRATKASRLVRVIEVSIPVQSDNSGRDISC